MSKWLSHVEFESDCEEVLECRNYRKRETPFTCSIECILTMITDNLFLTSRSGTEIS